MVWVLNFNKIRNQSTFNNNNCRQAMGNYRSPPTFEAPSPLSPCSSSYGAQTPKSFDSVPTQSYGQNKQSYGAIPRFAQFDQQQTLAQQPQAPQLPLTEAGKLVANHRQSSATDPSPFRYPLQRSTPRNHHPIGSRRTLGRLPR